jgi:hypothetical protein
MRMRLVLGCLLALLMSAFWANGCAGAVGCLGGDDGTCVPPSPCVSLSYACDDRALELFVVRGVVDRPPGLDALAARGDIRLGNSRMVAVIDGIGEPHHLAATGGTLIDLVPRDKQRGTGNDELNQVLQTVGILPDDTVRYTKLELVNESPDLVAVVARGRLYGRNNVHVVTRYEVRPCEPGIRIRTELYHDGRDPQAFYLADAYWWGGREVTPFVPLRGQGFVYPDLDLLELDESIFDVPFMAAQGHAPGAAAYGTTRCDAPSAEAFQSTTVSALGRERTVVMPGDGFAFERFISVAHGPGAGEAIDTCRIARGLLFGEHSVVVSGVVRPPSGEPLDPRILSVEIYQPAPGVDPDSSGGRTPQNQTVPAADGSFSMRVPPGRDYRVRVHMLGRPLPTSMPVKVGARDLQMDDVVVPRIGLVVVDVSDENGDPVIADVVLTPAEPTKADDVAGSVHGQFDLEHCVPYLGSPHGESPACNRVLIGPSGSASFAVPLGRFWLYASRGPFATIAREVIDVQENEDVLVSLTVSAIDGLIPAGSLSADFHVHAGPSFDSSLPEIDRAISFVSSGVDVLAATDHDVVTTYGGALTALGIRDRVVVMPGVETTGQFLFHEPPGSEIPQVIGHFNFWPLVVNLDKSRNGAPFDELVEPGALFDRMEPLYDGGGVAQLNHPFADSVFGRDEGYLSAIDYDPRKPVPGKPNLTPEGQLPRRPGGGQRNIDHDVQEVMNGASTKSFLNFRAGWFSFLNQGIIKGGTANSDSHTLAVEVLGYPRTIVLGGHDLANFERERFNADVRNGRMIGTNGPVITACIEGADGLCHNASLTPFEPLAAAELRLLVRAAPWIPVQEIRIIVNGKLVRTIDDLVVPSDPFGSDDLVRYEGSIALDELLTGDGWIVVEAGMKLWPAADLNDDGLVDTTDNNGDGVIDGRDIDEDDEDDGTYEEPKVAGENDPRFHLDVIAPGTYPTSFTNPMLIDQSGDGWEAPGL